MDCEEKVQQIADEVMQVLNPIVLTPHRPVVRSALVIAARRGLSYGFLMGREEAQGANPSELGETRGKWPV